MHKRFHWLAGLLLVLATVPALAVATKATLSAIHVTPGTEGAKQVSIEATAPLTLRSNFVLPNPDRVVLNLPSVNAQGIGLPADYKGKLIKAIRFGQFDPQTSRIVIDTVMPVTVNVSAGRPLLVTLSPTGPLSTATEQSAPVQTSAPTVSKSVPAAKLVAEPEDKKPLIAIDAGHGGQDPGAIGVHDTHERDVTLNFALALRKALLRTGRYRVTLTRGDDEFVMLHDRVNIARKAHADLLISMHADSNPRPEARGLSIYTLSATASDAEAASLAERENKADVISGIDLNTTDADVAGILIDLTQRETMNKSTMLADSIVQSLHPKITRLPSTHRFAGFRVLKAPDVPSVLIELGFLSNPTDERLLLSPEYRDVVVDSVIKGIDRYYAGQ